MVLIISENLTADTQSSCRFHRTQENCQEIERFNFSVTVPLDDGISTGSLPNAPFDPFIFAVEGFNHGAGTSIGRGLEIHLDDYEPIQLGNPSLELMGDYDDRSDIGTGSLYRTENGLRGASSSPKTGPTLRSRSTCYWPTRAFSITAQPVNTLTGLFQKNGSASTYMALSNRVASIH